MGRDWRVELGRFLNSLWAFLVHPVTRYVAAWLLAVTVACVSLHISWNMFNEGKRKDGNRGHAYIDFGGQYLMGRMLVRGHGRDLYHRSYQRLVLSEVYPPDCRDPDQKENDVEAMMSWLMGRDDEQAAGIVAALFLPWSGQDGLSCAVSIAAVEDFVHPQPVQQAAAALGPLAAESPLEAAVLAAQARQACIRDRLQQACYPQPPPVGGPLYPPINALYYYPLALLRPQPAYRAFQVLAVLLAFASGLGIRVLSQGRVWCPVAAAAIIIAPGFSNSLNLGQNAAVSLTMLIWGWVLMARGRQGLGGAVWGLLAFKPVWAAAFLLVPVLSRRWRVCAAMVGTGAALAALTLPAVGVSSWLEWLHIGSEATEVYKADDTWVHLSRDLLSFPRRWLDFGPDASWVERRDNFPTTLVGWILLAAALELTVRWALLRPRRVRQFTGPGPAFLLLGAWLCCFHFMYYDVLLTALPVLLLFTEPRQYLVPRFLAVMSLPRTVAENLLKGYHRPAPAGDYPAGLPALQPGYGNLWLINPVEPVLVVVFLAAGTIWGWYTMPYDTFCAVAIWAWCGWRCARESDEAEGKGLLSSSPALAAPESVEQGSNLNGPVRRADFSPLEADQRAEARTTNPS